MSRLWYGRVAGLCTLLTLCSLLLEAQPFYFGADLSYVNEMEDCGVVYREEGSPKDVYEIFSDHGTNLVRLRLWHTPSWYDALNSGNRYSDLADVRLAIARAHAQGMDVLLDFHLSDNWADPSKQVVPAAWSGIVDDLPVLKDSLYNYIHQVLTELHAEDLLPEMVQIGNETNKGILQSQAANDGGWVLDWNRNSQLFTTAIDAVRAVETETGKNIRIAIHVADPVDAVWLFRQFIENGVTDFDVMGISYYWAWHQPTGIQKTGDIIAGLIHDYPGYDVMIFETGYIWTTQSNDNANNIISDVHPDYAPASPEHQKQWLIDLTQEVINRGGIGVIYWEPAWVSSPCWTQWGQGSHQEHAAFFDFDNNLLVNGGMDWMAYPYENLSGLVYPDAPVQFVELLPDTNGRNLTVVLHGYTGGGGVRLVLLNVAGQEVMESELGRIDTEHFTKEIGLPELRRSMYVAMIQDRQGRLYTEKIVLGK